MVQKIKEEALQNSLLDPDADRVTADASFKAGAARASNATDIKGTKSLDHGHGCVSVGNLVKKV